MYIASLTTVSLTDWVAKLQNTLSKEVAEPEVALPYSRILRFFQAMCKGKQGLRYHNQKNRNDSNMMRSISPVDLEKIKAWIHM